MTRFTYHAQERINERLKGLVTAAEVIAAIESADLKPGENYIDVKKFSKRIYLGDPYNPDTPKGDKITAKVILDREAKVITVMLRKSTSKSSRYQ